MAADYFQQCKEQPNLPIIFEDIMVLQISEEEFAFNGNINFVKPVGNPWKLNFQLTKCKSKENPKSCSPSFKFSVDDICKKLPEKNQVWSGFVEDMNLNTKCPIQPKKYPIENIKIGADSVKYFPVGAGYYKLKIEGFSNANKLLCADIAFTIICKK
ncbi:hypothetical protein C0J52_25565 [Blattella germanica]|nr:hypothetical protein C0J52_25565 [Blattella germanica]